MADEAKVGEGEPEPKAPDEGELECVDWTCVLTGLERIAADPEDEDDQDSFSVKFQVDGPNANAEIEIIVADAVDEAHVIAIAQHRLHVATTMWSRITAERFIAARAHELPK